MFIQLDWLLRWLLGARMVCASALLCCVMTGCIKTGSPPKTASTLASTITAEARPQLEALYAQAAKAVTHDGTLATPRLRSTLDVAEYVSRLNGYLFAGPNRLATDEFSHELDRRWLAVFGKSDADLTPELRAKAAALLQGVADDL